MPDLFEKAESAREAHADLVAATGADPFGIRIDAVTSPTEAVVAGRDCLLLGSNNYLGLTFDSAAVESACEALRDSGTGTTGSRAANGSYSVHLELERRIAEFFGRERALLFSTGYNANVGFLSAVGGRDDVILIDADCHASIYDGCRMSDATILRFRHNDPTDLDRRLRRLPPEQNKLVVTEGIYSMLGDRAPLAELVSVARKHGAWTMVDEAHSFGVLGETGRGLAEEAGVEDQVDFILGTFSKSAGAIGGFCLSNHPALDSLRLTARAYLFTASLPPSVAASVKSTLARIGDDPSLMDRLWRNARHLYEGLAEQGFDLGPEVSPIIAVRMPDLHSGARAWKILLDEGVYVNLATSLAVPDGGSLLRCSVCAAHSPEQLDRILEVFSTLPGRLAEEGVLNGVPLSEPPRTPETTLPAADAGAGNP